MKHFLRFFIISQLDSTPVEKLSPDALTFLEGYCAQRIVHLTQGTKVAISNLARRLGFSSPSSFHL